MEDVAPALLGDTASQKADVFWMNRRMSVQSGCKINESDGWISGIEHSIYMYYNL
jgi:hypothetical protein